MELLLNFKPKVGIPLYRSLAQAIVEAIEDNRLSPGQKLISIRDLSETAKVSRNTAHQAYQFLLAQGYVQITKSSGIFVSDRSQYAQQSPKGTEENSLISLNPSEFAKNCQRLSAYSYEYRQNYKSMLYHMPQLEDLPLNTIRKSLNKYSKFDEPELVSYTGDPFGSIQLRKAIAKYLLRARSIHCSPEQIVIASRPTQQILDLILRLYLHKGEQVVVEDPGFPWARQLFQLHGLEIAAVHVDQNGIQVEKIEAEINSTKLVYVTPSHQDPTGSVLSLERRKKLLELCAKSSALIWEDDIDNEYHYGSNPLPAIYALDDKQQVIYSSTFWRTLFPLIRLGFVVLPKHCVELVYNAKMLLDRDLPILEQTLLVDLLESGAFEKQIRLLRNEFAKRRQTAYFQLSTELSSLINIERETSGLHLLAHFHENIPETLISACAKECSLPLTSTKIYYQNQPKTNEYIVQFAHTKTELLAMQISHFAALIKNQL